MRDDDCEVGEVCVDAACAPVEEPTGPRLVVSPTVLDFGAPLSGEAVARTLTLENKGDSVLAIDSLAVQGDDAPQDFFIDSDAAQGFSLDPGQSRDVEVTLVWKTGKPPSATLLVFSNTAKGKAVQVPLRSSWEGEPVLRVCVLSGGTDPYSDCADPAEIDFGIVAPGDTADHDVAVYNGGDGNAPLEVSGAAITGATKYVDLFELAAVFRISDGMEIESTLPVSLGPTDPDEAIYLRTRFHGDALGAITGASPS